MFKQEEIYFPLRNTTRKLHIYIPDHSEGLLPVMYYFDGHNLFFNEDATYGKSWGLYEFLENYEKPFIVVGIECSHIDNQRLEEYCPYHYHGYLFDELPHYGKETMDWIVNEVKPYIEANYPVYTNRECVGIAGSSMGGLMSLYGIINYNHIFSKAACLSSTIMPGVKNIIADIHKQKLNPDTRIYFSYGEKESSRRKIDNYLHTKMGYCHMQIIDELKKQSIYTKLVIQEKGKHNEASWEKLNPDYYSYLWLES